MKLGKIGPGIFAALAALLFAACGPGEVTVTAELSVQGPDGETANRPLGDLEVQLLPYDRDLIFDSLTQAAPTPEPEIPPDILAAQEGVAQAQRVWRDTEVRWNTLRDTLQSLTGALDRLNRGETRYVALFREWTDLDRQYQTVERQVQTAFQRFEELQAGIIERIDSIRIVRADWGDEAYADVAAVMAAKVAAAGLDPLADTTDAQGTITFQPPPGDYWVYARHELPYDELYWNEPISVARGEPLLIRLSRENAELRPIF